MKSKNFVIFLIVLAVLSGIVFMKKIMRQKVPTTEQWANIVEQSANKDDLTDCLITLGEKKLHLEKKNGKWTIAGQQGAYADEQKVDTLISKIDALEGELRSDNKKLLSDYGISDNEGINIQLKKGEAEIAQLILGTKKAEWNKNFVRLKGSNAVYVVEENILSDLGFWGDVTEANFNTDQWIDKRIFHFDQDKVKAVKLEKNAKTFIELVKTVENEKKKWKTIKNYPIKLDQNKVNNYIRSLTNLKGSSVAAKDEEEKFEETAWRISIRLDDDGTITLNRGKKDGGNYLVKLSDKAYMLKASEYTLNNIDKTDGDFFVNNPLGLKEDEITAIKINDLEDKKEISIKKFDESEQEDSSESLKLAWKSDAGDIFKTDDVKGIIRKIKNISLKTLPERTQSIENLLLISLTKQDGSASEYEITKSVSLDNNKECHYLKTKHDDQGYCVGTHQIASLKTKIAELDKNKTKPEGKETKVEEGKTEKDEVVDKSLNNEDTDKKEGLGEQEDAGKPEIEKLKE